MANNHLSCERDPNTDEFLNPRGKEIFDKIYEKTDIDSYVSDSAYDVQRVFVTTKSFDSYTPTCTVALRIKRIVEVGKTADLTMKSFDNSIIRCTTSVESVEIPFSTFRDLWNKNKTEATDFGFKLKQKPIDTITITIFFCKYCFDAYGESSLTDMSTATIISDIYDSEEQRILLNGNKTYNMTFSSSNFRICKGITGFFQRSGKGRCCRSN